MARLDARAAWLLVVALGLTAAIGFGQGLNQALKAPRPEQVAAGVDPSRDPVPATALTGAAPALDEARIRAIAHEEAVAALGATHKKAAPAPKDDDDSPSDDSAAAHPATAEPAGPASTPAPAATPPSAATPG